MKKKNRMKKKSLRMTVVFLAIILAVVSIPVNADGFIGSMDETVMGEDIISAELKWFEENEPKEVYPVIIWLKRIDTTQAVAAALSEIPEYELRSAYLANTVRLTAAESEEYNYYIDVKRDAVSECYQAYNNDFISEYLSVDEVVYCSRYIPVIHANLTYEKIKAIALRPSVELITYDAPSNVEVPEETETASVAAPLTTNSVPNGYYTIEQTLDYMNIDYIWDWGDEGQGVNIGIMDAGMPDVNHPVFAGLDIHAHYTPSAQYGPNNHHSAMLEIISSIAPEATFYCTSHAPNYGSPYNVTQALDWLLGNSVHVINISATVKSDGYNTYGDGARLLDYYVSEHHVTIVSGAGNDGAQGIISGGMAYNSIVVGDYNRYNDVIDPLSSYSVALYPYKPDICAPGYLVRTFPNDKSGKYYTSGTSNATAVTTGVVALLMTGNVYLKEQPVTVKAVLMTSVSMSTPHHYQTTDANFRWYGAGVLDAKRAYDFIPNMTYTTGYMEPQSFIIPYTISLTSGTTTRISLAFLKKVTETMVTRPDINFVVRDPSGNQIAMCISPDCSIEIFEFVPTTSGTYTIMVSKGASTTIPIPFIIVWMQ